jgi:hypothetical protein
VAARHWPRTSTAARAQARESPRPSDVAGHGWPPHFHTRARWRAREADPACHAAQPRWPPAEPRAGAHRCAQEPARPGRVVGSSWPPEGRFAWTRLVRLAFPFSAQFSDPGVGSGPVRTPRFWFLAGFYLHHLKHIPLHATVPWGGRLRLRKEGILAEEVLNTPKFPSPINRSPFLTPKDTREEL